MVLQRWARFFLWFGFALLVFGLFGLIISCGAEFQNIVAERNTSTNEINIGAGFSTLFILAGLLLVVIGSVMKAISRHGSEVEEQAPIP